MKEVEPAGMDRVREALEANDWGGDEDDDNMSFGSFEDGEDDGDVDPLKSIGDEMGREMFGLHNAIFGDESGAGEEGDNEEMQVEKLEAMMMRMATLKGMDIRTSRINSIDFVR